MKNSGIFSQYRQLTPFAWAWLGLWICSFGWAANNPQHSHGISLYGSLNYPEHFSHLAYVNPAAPKGGTLRLAEQGSFDSLNTFIAKGNASSMMYLLYDSLATNSLDEPDALYGLIAQHIALANDKKSITFTLNPKARWHDGTPITADDVTFTFQLLIEHGAPHYALMYNDILSVNADNRHTVTFMFKTTENRELPLIAAQMPILPKHFWSKRSFTEQVLSPPLGSGPYRVGAVDAGKKLTFERVKNYWAKHHPMNKGRFNFDTITVDFFRDSTVMLEALKAYDYDLRVENVSKQWNKGYQSAALSEGWLIKEAIPHSNPTGMQAFILNQRNPLFQDIRVRKALNLAFDFEWTNQQLFHNAYTRAQSYFNNSELAATGLPSPQELAILTPLKGLIPQEAFTEEPTQPQTDGSGNNRHALLQARDLLAEAGWTIQDFTLKNEQGQPFQMEFLIYAPTFERVLNPFIRNLKKLGIDARIRKVEIANYINRMRQFSFDVLVASLPQSLSPGLEQKNYWHSQTANTPSSNNIIGIQDKAIDQLVELIITAPNREALITRTRALDRVLLHQWFVIPQWYINTHRVAYWDKFGKPAVAPRYDRSFLGNVLTWWIDEKRLQALESR